MPPAPKTKQKSKVKRKKNPTLGLTQQAQSKLWGNAKARTLCMTTFLKTGNFASQDVAREQLVSILEYAERLLPPTRPAWLVPHERGLVYLRELIKEIDAGHNTFWNKYFEAREVEATAELDFQIGANKCSVFALKNIVAREENTVTINEESGPSDMFSPAKLPSGVIVDRPLPSALAVLIQDYPGAADCELVDCRPTVSAEFCRISRTTRVKYAEYLGNMVDHLVKNETHQYLVKIFETKRTEDQWVASRRDANPGGPTAGRSRKDRPTNPPSFHQSIFAGAIESPTRNRDTGMYPSEPFRTSTVGETLVGDRQGSIHLRGHDKPLPGASQGGRDRHSAGRRQIPNCLC
ncbi:hypothetical protein DFS34DRAFT_323742 [Phlyctochytrium arcticum]|nr:hypothetical protein DFS34DRAFT_323742 [Phlyctochytrium arcticum]